MYKYAKKNVIDKLLNLIKNRLYTSSNLANIKINVHKFDDYDFNYLDYAEVFDDLFRQGFISYKNNKKNFLEHIVLVEENALIFFHKHTDEEEPQYTLDKLITIIDKFPSITGLKIKDDIITKIKNHKSIKKFLNDKYSDCCKACSYIENNKTNVFERNFSNDIFSNSKRLREIYPLLVGPDFFNDDNLYSNNLISVCPQYVTIKGTGIININGCIIDLSLLKSPISIYEDNFPYIKLEKINRVFTIENATPFFNCECNDGLVIFSEGQPTNVIISFLKLIKSLTSAIFYHWGDVDLGGLLIFNSLCKKTDIQFSPYLMNEKIFIEMKKYWIPLSTIEKKDIDYFNKLRKQKEKEDFAWASSLIDLILDNKSWLEQESFFKEFKNIILEMHCNK